MLPSKQLRFQVYYPNERGVKVVLKTLYKPLIRQKMACQSAQKSPFSINGSRIGEKAILMANRGSKYSEFRFTLKKQAFHVRVCFDKKLLAPICLNLRQQTPGESPEEQGLSQRKCSTKCRYHRVVIPINSMTPHLTAKKKRNTPGRMPGVGCFD